MNENVVKVLKENLWYLATSGDTPNVVPVGMKLVTDDGKLLIGDVFMQTTMKNIKENGKAAIAVCGGENGKEGYQVKGKAEYVTEGPLFDVMKEFADKVFAGRRTIKGAVVVTPEHTIITTAGPDNNKEI